MRQGAGQARKAGTRLFLAYITASLVPLLALGAARVHDIRAAALESGLGQGKAQAAVIAQMAIAPALSDLDGTLSGALRRDHRERLHAATDLSVYTGSVRRLRLRSFEGATVFSDDGTTLGAVPVTDPAFVAAAAGQVQVSITADPVDGTGQVVRVLQPVVATMTGRAVGVLELDLPYDEVAARSEAQLQRSYRRLGLGLSVLYVVLAVISWSSSRSLRRQAAEREHEALHDGLTGLPNREAFRARLSPTLSAALPDGGAVVLVDLDGFKAVNDALGHAAGDELLQLVSRRLQEGLRAGDTLARLGGDEFVLLLPGVAAAEHLLPLLEQALDRVREPAALRCGPVRVGASLGVAVCPADGTELDGLLQAADQAMYRAKRDGGGIALAGEVPPEPARVRVPAARAPEELL